MSAATAGRAKEYRVRDEFIQAGWVHIMRAAGSRGAADLVMAHEDYGVALIQVGSQSKTLGPADRDRLCDAAQLCSALPLLAIIRPREKTQTYIVDRGKPGGWAAWS